MKTTTIDYVTHDEFQTGIKDLRSEMQIMEFRLSERLSNRINDTYWKLIPLMFGLMALINGTLYFSIKALIE